ncbi:MAG: patatin-like phospholipase family protein [Acidimicrobiia bacterium]|nr:patatin-like phospholipase family protein [Acidimicrobiia bacterium]
MLFHVGALRRLNEAGFLLHIAQFSSVSGGSITSAVLGMHWSQLDFDDNGVARGFEKVEQKLFDFAGKWVDVTSVVSGVLTPGASIADKVTKRYKKHLFGDATLRDLPEGREFVVNATNLQTGRLVRFGRDKIATYGVGEIREPTLDLASAVAASSAFPPVLSPKVLELEDDAWQSRGELAEPPYTTHLALADGGVYDNLGLERTTYLHTVLVSDGGAPFRLKPRLKLGWVLQSKRAWLTTDRQVRALRKRQLIAAYKRRERLGTYWGIATNIEGYEDDDLTDPLPCNAEATTELAEIKTMLRPISKRDRYRLINWGYVVCDAAIRTHLDRSIPRPAGIPHPKHPLT